MVDEARVLRLLRSIADDTAVLQREAGANGVLTIELASGGGLLTCQKAADHCR